MVQYDDSEDGVEEEDGDTRVFGSEGDQTGQDAYDDAE